MVLLLAHRRWFKVENLKAITSMRRVVETFEKIKKAVSMLDTHRSKAMMLGYYLVNIADSSQKEEERVGSYKCIETELHHGFNRRRLLMSHRNSGLDRILLIHFTNNRTSRLNK